MPIDPTAVAVASRSFSRNPTLRRELLDRYPGSRFNDEGTAVLSGDRLIEFLRGAGKAITGLDVLDEAVFRAVPELRLVSKYGVGLDMIDLEAARRHGVAVRWTSHPALQRMIAAYGDPITSTSANLPGLPPAMTAGEIVEQWGDAVARGILRVLDGGRLEASAPSTVVDCTGRRPRVIRPGAIPADVLRESVQDLIGDA